MGHHEMGGPKPRRQGQPGSMHRRAGGEGHVYVFWAHPDG
jgi:hypothetical protein